MTMVTPSLKLTFIKGPRDGDTLHFTPGSTIRLGRIVRGNEIAIKDAGISTKHLRIASISGNWVIQDLGSSNGTSLNSIFLDPDTPVDLRHGDTIKLGEYTSIVVNFVIDVQEQKLPSRPRRNNRRLANPDPVPDGSVPVKPAAKLNRAPGSSVLGEMFEEEKASDVKFENEPRYRVSKARKITNSEKLGSKEGNFKIPITRNDYSIQSSFLNSNEVAVENSGKGAKDSKATRSKNSKTVEKSCLGLVNVDKDETSAGGAAEEAVKEKRVTRATRSKRNEDVGDSYLELEMVLNRARKSCGKKKKKKVEQKPLKSFVYDEAGKQDPCSPTVVSCNKRVGMVEMDLGKMTLGEWLCFLQVHLPKQINHKTDCIIELMRSKSQRVREYIAEQTKVQAKPLCVELTKWGADIKHSHL